MNRYIKAMEIGLANEEKGISYFDLVYDLHNTKKKKFSRQAELTFFNWFQENFDCEDSNWNSRNYTRDFLNFLVQNDRGNTYHIRGNNPSLFDILNQPFFLKGTASKQYLDYQELQQSRIAANNAQAASKEANIKSTKSINLAIGAIIISGLLGLSSIGVGIWSIKSTSTPPFEVKIIEDKTNTEQLQKEVDSLKNEIYEAQMTIDSYESDLTNID